MILHSRCERLVAEQDAEFLAGEPAGSVHVSRSEESKVTIDNCQLQMRLYGILREWGPSGG